MGQDLGLEAELADSLAVLTRLLGGSRRGQLDVVGAELIESLSDLNLLGLVKVSVGESARAVSRWSRYYGS